MNFQTFHKYNRLVRRGDAQPLLCANCGNEVVTRLGELDTVRLWCYTCGASTVPGLDTCDMVRAVVEEFYLESHDID